MIFPQYPLSNKRGFTLLELLVAISITTVILMGAYGLITTVTTQQSSLDARHEEMLTLMHLQRLFSRDLRRVTSSNIHNAYPITFLDNEMILICDGDITGTYTHAPRVRVRYQFTPYDAGSSSTVLVREVTSMDGDTVFEKRSYAMRERGLKKSMFQVKTLNGWLDENQGTNEVAHGLRVLMEWEHLGRWQMSYLVGNS